MNTFEANMPAITSRRGLNLGAILFPWTTRATGFRMFVISSISFMFWVMFLGQALGLTSTLYSDYVHACDKSRLELAAEHPLLFIEIPGLCK